MLSISNITKSFGTRTVLKDISFEVPDGDVAVLLGPNGAGKTTTMRIMTGYYAPDEGDVTIGDVSVVEDPVAARRLVGYLPESNPLYRDFLVSEYLTWNARVAGVSRSGIRSALDRVVAETGIDEVFFRPITELSKGFRQRVGLASALVADPSVLILDEPTEGLDPNQRSDIRSLLAKLARNKTVLVSTHVLGEAQQIASRVIVLNRGEVVRTGTVEELQTGAAAHGFILELEGSHPDKATAKLASVEDVTVLQTTGSRVRMRVLTKDAQKLPRELSNLIGSHKLIVWRFEPEVGGLERAFVELTREPSTTASDEASDTSVTQGS